MARAVWQVRERAQVPQYSLHGPVDVRRVRRGGGVGCTTDRGGRYVLRQPAVHVQWRAGKRLSAVGVTVSRRRAVHELFRGGGLRVELWRAQPVLHGAGHAPVLVAGLGTRQQEHHSPTRLVFGMPKGRIARCPHGRSETRAVRSSAAASVSSVRPYRAPTVAAVRRLPTSSPST